MDVAANVWNKGVFSGLVFYEKNKTLQKKWPNKMKQFFVKHLFPIPPPYGGISVFVRRITLRMLLDGLSTGALYTQKKHIKENFPKGYWKHFHRNFPVARIFGVNYLMPFNLLYMLYVVRNYQIVHIHSGLAGLIYAWVLIRCTNKKIVITIHDAMLLEYYRRLGIVKRHALLVLTKSTRVHWVAVSAEVKRLMMCLPVTFRFVEIIPAYIAPVKQEFSISKLPAGMVDFMKNHKYIISVYGSGFQKYKGVDVYGYFTAVNALNVLRKNGCDCGLVVCCSIWWDVERDKLGLQSLKELIAKLKLDDFVFIQTEPIKEGWMVWKASSVYIRPTATDGDSVAIRECISLSVPVVASDVTARPQGTRLYRFGDDTALVNAISNAVFSQGNTAEDGSTDSYRSQCDLYMRISNH